MDKNAKSDAALKKHKADTERKFKSRLSRQEAHRRLRKVEMDYESEKELDQLYELDGWGND